jgi:hypothetical protein
MKQLSLLLEPGIGSRNRCLRDHLAVNIHRDGLVAIAGKMDLSPSRLSEKLAGVDSSGKARGLTCDELEVYIQRTGDTSPILYLVDKYLQDPAARQAETTARIEQLLGQLAPLIEAVGLGAAPASRRRPRA